MLGARFMQGSRLRGYSSLRKYGNIVYNNLFSLAVLHGIYDLGSGLNMYRLDAFQDFYYKTFPDDLSFNYVMLLASYARKHEIKYVPISWREEDQVSNVKLFSQSIKVLALLAGYFCRRNSFLKRELRSTQHSSYSGMIQYCQEAIR